MNTYVIPSINKSQEFQLLFVKRLAAVWTTQYVLRLIWITQSSHSIEVYRSKVLNTDL